jgi:hypothetical protein
MNLVHVSASDERAVDDAICRWKRATSERAVPSKRVMFQVRKLLSDSRHVFSNMGKYEKGIACD